MPPGWPTPGQLEKVGGATAGWSWWRARSATASIDQVGPLVMDKYLGGS